MTNKQEIELFYARPILDHIGIGDVVSSDKPDLLFCYLNRNVGAEVVFCYPNANSNGLYRRMENRAHEFRRKYEAKLKEEGVKGRMVSISFTDDAYVFDENMSNKQFNKIAFEEIEKKQRLNEYEIQLSNPEVWNDYVESFQSNHLSDSEAILVLMTRTAYCLTINADDVIEYIRRKEQKLFNYRKSKENVLLDEYWLFICNPGGSFNNLDGFEMPPFDTSYDRVYINDFRHIIQLK